MDAEDVDADEDEAPAANTAHYSHENVGRQCWYRVTVEYSTVYPRAPAASGGLFDGCSKACILCRVVRMFVVGAAAGAPGWERVCEWVRARGEARCARVRRLARRTRAAAGVFPVATRLPALQLVLGSSALVQRLENRVR